MKLKYISLFSGIEAVSCALDHDKWEAIAFSEIDLFPSAVLKAHYPNIPNLGDITKIDWSEYVGSIDVIWGGSPCQSFSIAGKREGLNGASGLMWEYVRTVREVRPRFFVWENVPGALSSSHGEDFRCLLKSMDELGYGLAWRVLDAQFFGVPQRRRRVFLVGSLGNQRAAEVLFDKESMCRDYPTSRQKKKAVTNGAYGRAKTMFVRYGKPGGGKGALIQDDMSATLPTSNIQTLFAPITMMDTQSNAAIGYDQCNTLTAHAGNDAPIVATGYNVRRLTPVECERLQGFPDGWTDVTFNGNPATDSKRYKALGNSMAVPVMRWIGERVYSCFIAE